MKIDFEKSGGLVPVIVQHAKTEQVLMLGYMNADALARTKETGLVTFYSRSRHTLLVRARPKGPTCHEGTTSCFGDGGPEGIGFLGYLENFLEARKTADPEKSYTASLLQGPLRRAAQKVGEEGVETALASVAETDDKLISEAADLIFHLTVLLRAKNIPLQDVINELKSRHA